MTNNSNKGNMEITINLNDLRAVSLFAAGEGSKKPDRFKAVHIRVKAGAITYSASDVCCAAILRREIDNSTDGPWLWCISPTVVRQLVNIAPANSDVLLHLNAQRDFITMKHPLGGIKVHAPLAEGQGDLAADLIKLMPEKFAPAESMTANHSLLRHFSDAAAILEADGLWVGNMTELNTGIILLIGVAEFIGLLMPMRTDKEPRLQDWVLAEKGSK